MHRFLKWKNHIEFSTGISEKEHLDIQSFFNILEHQGWKNKKVPERIKTYIRVFHKKKKNAQGESTSAFKILEDNDFELRILSPQTLKAK